MSKRRQLSKAQERSGPDTPQPQTTEEQIQALAHQYWIDRGSPIGSPDEDWFRAEEEIRRRGYLEKDAKK